MKPKSEIDAIIRQVRQHLQTEAGFGVDVWPTVNPRSSGGEHVSPKCEPGRKPETPEEKREAMEKVRPDLQGCDRCRLCGQRTNLVFGVGNADARLMFIGEAPGADEDRQGEPFVGRAGQLLTHIIEAMGLERADVYIANILKCRPPGNRNPQPDEIIHCLPFLRHQIDIIQPEILVFLGNIAAQTLLQTTEGIGRLRGKFQEYRGIKAMCTYHPAYLLRNPDAKKLVWEDVQKVMDALGLQPPKKPRNT